MRERLKSHTLDAFSLVCGLLFVVLGTLVAVDASPSREVDPRWIVAVLLVGLGLAGILGSLDWPGRDPDDAGHDAEHADPPHHHPPNTEKEST
ncbi:MAG TPA: hypothetical protein VF152_00940 [Acidimicrobiia bacterium]